MDYGNHLIQSSTVGGLAQIILNQFSTSAYKYYLLRVVFRWEDTGFPRACSQLAHTGGIPCAVTKEHKVSFQEVRLLGEFKSPGVPGNWVSSVVPLLDVLHNGPECCQICCNCHTFYCSSSGAGI